MIKVGIDIGNSKITCIVCDNQNNGKKNILSFINYPTKSIIKSSIINLKSLKKEIQDTIDLAEKQSQTKIKSISLNIPAVDSSSVYLSSSVEIKSEKISDLHIKKAINQSNFLELVDNYSIIFKSILNYELDNNLAINDPRGMYGEKLKVNFYKFLVKENFIKTISKLFENLDIHIENFVPTPLSSALATLNLDDKLLGTICIDLGSSSTSFSVFENEKLLFLNSIKVGGMHITNDIARKFSTTIESAERLKTLYGSVVTSPSDEYELIDIPIIGSDPQDFQQINRSNVNAVIKPRVEETLELVWQKLKDYNLHKRKIKNVIITGGGALLEGISEYAQVIFDSNVRIGKPAKIPGLRDEFSKPSFSQTVGLVLYEHKNYAIDLLENREKIKKNDIISRFSTWLDQYI